MWKNNVNEIGVYKIIKLKIQEEFDKAYDKDLQCYEDGTLEYVTTGFRERNGFWNILIPSHPTANIDDMFAAGIRLSYPQSEGNNIYSIYHKDGERIIKIIAWDEID